LTGNPPLIAGSLPRRSALQRKRAYDPLSEAQILGANVDLVGVVLPLDRPLSTNRLERTLVAVWDSGAVPLVNLTKADLSTRFDDALPTL
jgi:ribosome biogenesis GTPase